MKNGKLFNDLNVGGLLAGWLLSFHLPILSVLYVCRSLDPVRHGYTANMYVHSHYLFLQLNPFCNSVFDAIFAALGELMFFS